MFRSLILALVAAFSLFTALPAARAEDDLTNSKVRVADENGDGGYRVTKDKNFKAVRDRVMKRKALEEFARFLSPLKLSNTLWLYTSDCDGVVNAFYNPDERSIKICYGFVEYIEKTADRLIKMAKADPKQFPAGFGREEFITGAFIGVVLHETGHAVFDLLDVPVFGREEDAADQMAVFLALQFDKDVARSLIKAISYMWAAGSNPPTEAPSEAEVEGEKDANKRCGRDPFCAYADEHGTDYQRMFNSVCVAYGADPKAFKDFATAGWVPKNRDCAGEYQKLRMAFGKTIYPFLDPTLLKKVQSIKWLRPNEIRK